MRDPDWELLDRYLAGQATPDEREEFERWLAERPQHAAALEAWRQALEGLENQVATSDRAAVWSGALETVGLSSPEPLKGRPADSRRVSFELPHRRAPRFRTGIGLAAAAVIAVGAALGGRALLTGGSRSEQVERVVTVPPRDRARFQLPDGSQVMLAAGSTLRHPRSFDGKSREVTLEGEAYFTVEHDPRRPFTVLAGDLIATDLGTEFLVRAYPEDPKARVVVRSGEVAVRPAQTQASGDSGQVVRPGELGRLGPDGVPRVERADTAAYFAWTQGTLVFDGTPLRDALPQLSRWYDLDFQLADSSLGGIPLSGRLDQALTEDRLDLLAGSLGLEQVRRGKVVTLSRGKEVRR